MRIAICDDEIVFRDILKEYCLQFAKEQQLECQIVEYVSGEELLEDSSPDVLLLDIEMKEIDGLQVRDILQRQKADIRKDSYREKKITFSRMILLIYGTTKYF